ncbi:hypothetical protein JCM4814A_73730 [Streptomyces phaeofaciens JCM 4814]|uniref:Lipoprotein n=1 Tax=Streptomyces phaeofaciens TaxID=68254 RepID=A0A918HGZ6_9ACTN|nr:hypothetical protein [Streptomyces phaeofaciens]GGT63080.1 hypothetical protein GCM10010226_46190 [Streptomyces phaeofaciens]
MRRTPAAPSTVTRSPRRLRPMLAMAALAALALTACGTEKPGAGGPQNSSADIAGVRSGAAFTEMLGEVAQQCPPSASPKGPPTGPARTLPSGETAPSDAIEPIAPTAGPEVELNARDWCASNLHEERIFQALRDLADPTPTKVRAVLNGLGYIDERIHGLRQSGTTTRFLLDLRDQGGRLCLDGSAAGQETVVEKCVAPATGPFKAGERNV